MPLSEHEQRVLDEIERQLMADDPRLAAQVGQADLRSHYRTRVVVSAVVVVFGIAAVILGAVYGQWYLVVLGAIVATGSAWYTASLQRHLTGPRGKTPATRGSINTRLQDRWARRWQDFR